MDGRLIVYVVWAVGCLIVWGLVFRSDLQTYRLVRRRQRTERRDRTALREMIVSFALFLVAVAASASILTLIIGSEIPGLRGFALAVALGAFLGAGIVRLTVDKAVH